MFTFFGMWVAASLGQAQVSLPPAGESGIIEKSLRQSRPEFKPPEEKIPEIVIKDSRTVRDPGAGPSFFVKRIALEGNTIFSDEALVHLIDVGDGLKVTLGVLNLFAQEITSFYAQNGYILTRAFIPQQEVVEGVVKILVVEGKLGDIEVIGNERTSTESIVERMQSVREEKILREQTLARALLQMNDAMGFEAKSVLKPGRLMGTSDMALEVEETRPYSISLDADNFGSRFTGEQRLGVTGKLGNIFTFGDRFSIRAVKSNEEQQFLNPSFIFPVNNIGTEVGLSFIYSDFTLGDSLVPLDAQGESLIYTLDVTHPIYRSRSAKFYISMGVEYRQFENSNLFGPTSNDKLLDGFLSAGGFFSDALRARTFYSIRVQQGFSEKNLDDSLNSRQFGHGDVFVATIGFRRYQSVFIANTYLVLKGTGQVAAQRVLSPDQLAVGGFGTVRGYPLAEVAGDNGFALSAEYVVPFPIKIALSDKPKIKSLDQILSFYGFIDHGQVFVNNKQPGDRDLKLTGAGAGLRLNIPQFDLNFPTLSLTFAVGFPVFEEISPSDRSSKAYYLGGLVSF